MNIVNIHIEDLMPFIKAAFDEDEEILIFYDRSQKVENSQDVCKNIFGKIKEQYETSTAIGVQKNGENVGYFVTYQRLLISFGVNKKFRDKEHLRDFFELIKTHFSGTFQTLLYSYNTRAISWLNKCGVRTVFEDVTVLQFDND